jgi:hypothetical protein
LAIPRIQSEQLAEKLYIALTGDSVEDFGATIRAYSRGHAQASGWESTREAYCKTAVLFIK